MGAVDGLDRAEADALNRYWDALVGAPVVHPGGPAAGRLDPTLTRAVRRLAAGDDAPRPDRVFATQLWEELIRPAEPSAVAGNLDALGLAPTAFRTRRLVELGLAAALLLAVVGGGMNGGSWLTPLAGGVPTAAASAAQPTATVVRLAAGCAASPTPRPTAVGEAPSPLPLAAALAPDGTAVDRDCAE